MTPEQCGAIVARLMPIRGGGEEAEALRRYVRAAEDAAIERAANAALEYLSDSPFATLVADVIRQQKHGKVTTE